MRDHLVRNAAGIETHPDRIAIRRTIVAMTILGPCRGLEEPPPSPPVGSSQQRADRR
jgi:hypothetical protein